MWAVSDALVVTIGGAVTAVITGGFATLGVLINARWQREPKKVMPDEDACNQCLVALHEMTDDRDRWRDIALRYLPERRHSSTDDPPPGVDSGGHSLSD